MNNRLNEEERDNRFKLLLKTDEWLMSEVVFMTDYPADTLERLIYSSIDARKLKPRRTSQQEMYGEPIYTTFFFDPVTIIDWAISKELDTLRPELLEWHGKQKSKLCNGVAVNPTEKQLVLELEKPFSETERNTMLKLIIGMAIDAYGYDTGKSKNSLTGENKDSLTAKLQSRGISISNDTIRKYLTDAKELI